MNSLVGSNGLVEILWGIALLADMHIAGQIFESYFSQRILIDDAIEVR